MPSYLSFGACRDQWRHKDQDRLHAWCATPKWRGHGANADQMPWPSSWIKAARHCRIRVKKRERVHDGKKRCKKNKRMKEKFPLRMVGAAISSSNPTLLHTEWLQQSQSYNSFLRFSALHWQLVSSVVRGSLGSVSQRQISMNLFCAAEWAYTALPYSGTTLLHKRLLADYFSTVVLCDWHSRLLHRFHRCCVV